MFLSFFLVGISFALLSMAMKHEKNTNRKNHPNLNLKKLLDGLQDNSNALILKAQMDEILNNKEIYQGEYIFEEESNGMYLISLSKDK